jgi:hypothetical protein
MSVGLDVVSVRMTLKGTRGKQDLNVSRKEEVKERPQDGILGKAKRSWTPGRPS